MSFDVVVTSFRVNAAESPSQVLERVLGLAPAAARELVRRFPTTVVAKTTKAHAEAAAAQLRDAGARVDVVSAQDPGQKVERVFGSDTSTRPQLKPQAVQGERLERTTGHKEVTSEHSAGGHRDFTVERTTGVRDFPAQNTGHRDFSSEPRTGRRDLPTQQGQRDFSEPGTGRRDLPTQQGQRDFSDPGTGRRDLPTQQGHRDFSDPGTGRRDLPTHQGQRDFSDPGTGRRDLPAQAPVHRDFSNPGTGRRDLPVQPAHRDFSMERSTGVRDMPTQQATAAARDLGPERNTGHRDFTADRSTVQAFGAEKTGQVAAPANENVLAAAARAAQALKTRPTLSGDTPMGGGVTSAVIAKGAPVPDNANASPVETPSARSEDAQNLSAVERDFGRIDFERADKPAAPAPAVTLHNPVLTDTFSADFNADAAAFERNVAKVEAERRSNLEFEQALQDPIGAAAKATKADEDIESLFSMPGAVDTIVRRAAAAAPKAAVPQSRYSAPQAAPGAPRPTVDYVPVAMESTPPSKFGGKGKIIGIGLGVGALILILIAMFSPPKAPPGPPPTRKQVVRAQQALEGHKIHPILRIVPASVAVSMGKILRETVNGLTKVQIELEEGLPEDTQCMLVRTDDGKGRGRLEKLRQTGLEVPISEAAADQFKDHEEAVREAMGDSDMKFERLCLSVEYMQQQEALSRQTPVGSE